MRRNTGSSAFSRSRQRLFAGVALLALFACAPPEPLRIGFVGEMSGNNTGFGVAGRNGALLAIENFNAAGGLNGRPAELVVADSTAPGIQALPTLAGQKVVAVVGALTSREAITAAPEANRLGLVLISPVTTAMELVGHDDMVFRLTAADDEHARFDAEFLITARQRQRFAIAYDLSNRAHSEFYVQQFSLQATTRGGTITLEQAYDSRQEVNSAALVRQMRDSGADTFVFVGTTFDSAKLAQQARLLAPQVLLFGSAWAANEEIIELGGMAVEGMYFGQYFRRQDTPPAFTAFAQAFSRRFKQIPGYISVGSYDATNVLLQALARQKSGQSLKQVLLEQGPYNGLQHSIQFDRYGDSRGVDGISVVNNKKMEAVPWP
jgi:branched-chain amino acid transport system substrate-binding protein